MDHKISIIFLLLISSLAILSCQNEKATPLRSKANSRAVMASVTISPEKPTKDSDLGAYIRSGSQDNRSTYSYQWIKNGEEISGEKGSILKRENFKKGDLIQCRVTPLDGEAAGKPILSAGVKILNSPPVIQKVWIEPRPADVTTEHLRASVRDYDPDGDLVYYDYRWERNGETLPGKTSEILERGQFKKGDVIRVFVTPNDKEVPGRTENADSYIE